MLTDVIKMCTDLMIVLPALVTKSTVITEWTDIELRAPRARTDQLGLGEMKQFVARSLCMVKSIHEECSS